MAEKTKHSATRAELRERIVLMAQAFFTRNGIKSVTMDEVAAALSISKRTLYEVFPDKETLLVEVVKQGQQEAHVYLQQLLRSTHNVLEVLLRMFKFSIQKFHDTNPRFFDEMKRYPKAFDLLTNRRREDTEYAMRFFREGVEQGIFRSDINFSIIHQLVGEQFNVLLHTDICARYPFIEVYESIMFTHLRGIATPCGADELEAFITEYRRERAQQTASVVSQ